MSRFSCSQFKAAFLVVSKTLSQKVSEVEFNQDFIARVIPKIDWDCLCRAAEQLGHLEDLPKVDPDARSMIIIHHYHNLEGDT